jgi:asparagine synthase (glutamine-hydrolysing)
MCGFIGGLGTLVNQIDQNNLGVLSNRGPDHQGSIKLNSGLLMIATRLAMTDPNPRSNQPMLDTETKNVLVFNGEIYNYKEIRKKLSNLGVIFKTDSDTEVLLKALSNFGLNILQDLEGMYSLVFFNQNDNSLLLARDFLGKKPLFYSIDNSNVLFSSSLKLIKNLKKTSNISLDSVYTYFRIGYTIDPKTIYDDINSVQPGEAILIDLGINKLINRSFFLPKAINQENQGTILEALDSEILRRVDGHSKFAISLSGGTDSSIIALRSKYLGLHPNAYSLSFTNSDKYKYSEDSRAALLIARKLEIKFESIEMPPPSTIPNLLHEFVLAMEEPNANPTGLAMLVLYAAMFQNGERLVLTGDGSDEIFGGYGRYNIANKLIYKPRINYSLIQEMDLFRFKLPKKIKDFLLSIEPLNSTEFWLRFHESLDNYNARLLLNVNSQINLTNHRSQTLKNLFGNNSRTSNLMIDDLCTWLAMESNRKLDRVSMWNSIEARSPFQSEMLIGKALSEMKSTNYKILNKKLLKNESLELNDLSILTHKRGFISPLGHWIRVNKDFINDSLNSLTNLEIFNTQYLKQLQNSIHSNKYSDFRLVWSLVVYNCWMELVHKSQ